MEFQTKASAHTFMGSKKKKLKRSGSRRRKDRGLRSQRVERGKRGGLSKCQR